MFLTREAILSIDDSASTLETVPVPEWGGEVKIRILGGLEREKLETAMTRITERPGGESLRALFVAYAACDEKGRPLFNAADIAALGAKSSKALDRVFLAARRLNALGREDVEALEKNSEAAT